MLLYQPVPKTFGQTSPNSILEEFVPFFLFYFMQILLARTNFSRQGHRASGFWCRLLYILYKLYTNVL